MIKEVNGDIKIKLKYDFVMVAFVVKFRAVENLNDQPVWVFKICARVLI